MSTLYRQLLQERISSLAAEHAQLEKQHSAVNVNVPAHPTPEQVQQHMKDWLVTNAALRKSGRRLREAKRLLARPRGDGHVSQKT